MNPQEVFCPNIECWARGQTGRGNIGVHSQVEKRYICHGWAEQSKKIYYVVEIA